MSTPLDDHSDGGLSLSPPIFVPSSRKRARSFLPSLLALVVLVGANTIGHSAWAQTTYTWNQPASGSWATSSNWTPARTSPATTDILVIDGSVTATPTLTAVP